MKNILIIGGSGTWSGVAYIPSIQQKLDKVALVGIFDPINPYYSNKTICHFDYFTENNVKWIKAKRDCNEELLKQCIIENNIDIVIISTPPKFHYEYTLVCLKCGVDIICDKPIIATPSQSSKFDCAFANVEKTNNLITAIKQSNNVKENRRCFVLTPLRRKIQDTYTNIYDTVKTIKEKFLQDVTNVVISHNDGVFRFYDELEFKNGSHGYSDGFGKLTHTGYHILDVVAGFIEFGCFTEDVRCECKVINCNTVEDMINSNSNKVNSKLLFNTSQKCEVSDIALKAEMDITISYTLYRQDKKFCNIVVDLLHTGKSNRSISKYDFNNYNDQGRTNELTLSLQQGSLFSCQLILNTMSGSNGTVGNGYTLKQYHPKVAEIMQKEQVEVLDFKNQSTKSTIDIISDFYDMISSDNLDGYYLYADFLNQKITNELYMSALISMNNGSYDWIIGKM